MYINPVIGGQGELTHAGPFHMLFGLGLLWKIYLVWNSLFPKVTSLRLTTGLELKNRAVAGPSTGVFSLFPLAPRLAGAHLHISRSVPLRDLGRPRNIEALPLVH